MRRDRQLGYQVTSLCSFPQSETLFPIILLSPIPFLFSPFQGPLLFYLQKREEEARAFRKAKVGGISRSPLAEKEA